MPPRIESFKRPEWEPVPMEGCENLEGRVLFWDDSLGLALLRFGEHGTIHEHPGPNDTTVCCLDGEGFTKVGGATAPIRSGQIVYWPADVPHGLWTEKLDHDDAHGRTPGGRKGRPRRLAPLDADQ